MIHNTVYDQLSLLLIPNFVGSINSSSQLRESVIELVLDDELAARDANWRLL
jgi:hypothetical protein